MEKLWLFKKLSPLQLYYTLCVTDSLEQDSHLEGKKNKLPLDHKGTLTDQFPHCILGKNPGQTDANLSEKDPRFCYPSGILFSLGIST